ncbi:Ankyrin repeat and death domain-containing protein 1B [Phlyctochytrium bullatum]|nr:Ankyrin repeat and death domain-containing protein 1B [Phlyctochytrium bullatum]
MSRILLDMGISPNVPDRNDETPFHLAVSSGCPDVIQVMPEAGATVNPIGSTGTPLHVACMAQQLDVVKTLDNLGADFDAPYSGGESVLHLVVQGAVNYQEKDEARRLLRYLLRRNPSLLEQRDRNLMTPLAFAFKHGQVNLGGALVGCWGGSDAEMSTVVGVLMDAGVDPMARDNNQKTPADFVDSHRPDRVSILRLLRDE